MQCTMSLCIQVVAHDSAPLALKLRQTLAHDDLEAMQEPRYCAGEALSALFWHKDIASGALLKLPSLLSWTIRRIQDPDEWMWMRGTACGLLGILIYHMQTADGGEIGGSEPQAMVGVRYVYVLILLIHVFAVMHRSHTLG